MSCDLEYFMVIGLEKPEEVSPRHALDAIYKHKTDHILWLDEVVSNATLELQTRLQSYGDVELVCVCTGLTKYMADAVFKVKLHSNTSRNRLKLSHPSWLRMLEEYKEDIAGKIEHHEIPNRVPRYDNVSKLVLTQ